MNNREMQNVGCTRQPAAYIKTSACVTKDHNGCHVSLVWSNASRKARERVAAMTVAKTNLDLARTLAPTTTTRAAPVAVVAATSHLTAATATAAAAAVLAGMKTAAAAAPGVVMRTIARRKRTRARNPRKRTRSACVVRGSAVPVVMGAPNAWVDSSIISADDLLILTLPDKSSIRTKVKQMAVPTN